jgi:hypothetical protein
MSKFIIVSHKPTISNQDKVINLDPEDNNVSANINVIAPFGTDFDKDIVHIIQSEKDEQEKIKDDFGSECK